jgi:hypothetical protein
MLLRILFLILKGIEVDEITRVANIDVRCVKHSLLSLKNNV